MGTYYINEAAFELPNLGFADETIHVLRAKGSRDGDINVLVFRSKLEKPRTPREVVTAHRDNERRTLAGFALLFDREVEVAGTFAIEGAIRYRNDSGMIYQRNAHFVSPEQHLLVAVNGPFEDKETCDAAMDHVLSTFQLRKE